MLKGKISKFIEFFYYFFLTSLHRILLKAFYGPVSLNKSSQYQIVQFCYEHFIYDVTVSKSLINLPNQVEESESEVGGHTVLRVLAHCGPLCLPKQ